MIGILARDGEALVIVEIKTNNDGQFGAAIEMISHTKQQKLILLAHELQNQYQTETVRVDIITVDVSKTYPVPKHYKNLIEFHG